MTGTDDPSRSERTGLLPPVGLEVDSVEGAVASVCVADLVVDAVVSVEDMAVEQAALEAVVDFLGVEEEAMAVVTVVLQLFHQMSSPTTLPPEATAAT